MSKNDQNQQSQQQKEAQETAHRTATQQPSQQGQNPVGNPNAPVPQGGSPQGGDPAKVGKGNQPDQPDGRASAAGGVGDQESADKMAERAKEKDSDPSQANKRFGGSGQVSGTNPQDGTAITQPTNDMTRPDATKGPLHNPGVVVEAGQEDPSPATRMGEGAVLDSGAKRDLTDPSRRV